MWIVANRSPAPEGSNCTWKVVEPPAATVRAGATVTVKSAAWSPVIVTGVAPTSVSTCGPEFWIVKVRVTVPPLISTLPKSVWSSTRGVVSPSAMSCEFPCTLMSAAVVSRISVGRGRDVASMLQNDANGALTTGICVRRPAWVAVPKSDWINAGSSDTVVSPRAEIVVAPILVAVAVASASATVPLPA